MFLYVLYIRHGLIRQHESWFDLKSSMIAARNECLTPWSMALSFMTSVYLSPMTKLFRITTECGFVNVGSSVGMSVGNAVGDDVGTFPLHGMVAALPLKLVRLCGPQHKILIMPSSSA